VRLFVTIALLAPLSLAGCFAAASDSPVPALLAARCQICHNDQTRAGGLSLQTFEGMRKGSRRGPAVVGQHRARQATSDLADR
jgi:hypothetical protein